MKDAEIYRLFDRVETSMADLRHHVDATAAETRNHFDAKAAEMREYMDAKVADLTHQYGIRTESLEDKIQLVVESVALLDAKVDRIDERNRHEMDRRFDETHNLIRVSYSSLDRRVTTLEEKVANLGD